MTKATKSAVPASGAAIKSRSGARAKASLGTRQSSTAKTAACTKRIAEVTRALSKPKWIVETAHTKDEHFYKVGDYILPGVTGVLKVIAKGDGLLNWAKNSALAVVEAALLEKMHGQAIAQITIDTEWLEAVLAKAKKRPEKLRDQAADLGTRVHEWIDAWIKGKPLPKITEDMTIACQSFLAFVEERGLIFVAGDTKLGSLTYGFGGALDWLAVDKDGALVLGDNKTSNRIYNETGAQLGGYDVGLFETYDGALRPNYGLILRIDKYTAAFEIAFVRDLVAAGRAFLAAKTLKLLLDNGLIRKETNHGNH